MLVEQEELAAVELLQIDGEGVLGERIVDRVLEQVALRHGDRVLLNNFNLTLHAGARLGVVGANGSGKTTLLRLLSQQLAPDQGAVRPAPGLRIVTFDQERRLDESAKFELPKELVAEMSKRATQRCTRLRTTRRSNVMRGRSKRSGSSRPTMYAGLVICC